MAELLEREAELESEQALDGGSAALALALDGAKHDPHLRSDIADFLVDQRRLIAAQLEHLHEQFAHLKLRHWGERLKLALQALTILVGVIILGGVLMLAWQAHQASGVVIEAFTAPPDMAAKGYSGQALASRIEDRLNELQAQTWDVRPAATYTNSWGHEIKVEIPETGVSLSELDRMLRQWLGRETHVDGDLVHTPQGLSLTIRSEAGGSEVEGDEADMSALTQKAAEALYARTQPYRYGAYLQSKGRNAEARAVWQELADEGAPGERAWALSGLAQVEDDPRVGEARAREALAISPTLAPAWLALFNRAFELGDLPTTTAALGKAVALIQGPGHGGYSDKLVLESHALAANLDTFTTNYFTCAREARSGLALARDSRVRGELEDALAFCLALLHETTAARAAVHNLSDAERMKALPDGAFVQTDLVAAYVDENGPELLRQAQASYALLTASSQPSAHFRADNRVRGMEAVALLTMGRVAEGKALVEGFPPACTQCAGYKAFALEVEGDHAGSDRLNAEVARSLPVPFAYNSWGRERLRLGDNDGAIAVFRQGVQHGAWYADNWQGWGEASLNKGDAAGAIAKFAEAQKTAPRWARLHLKWGVALAKLGRRDEARAQFAAAAGLDLTPSERIELAAQRRT
jgi:tetratricopeptide (TPR) repeat protein